MKKTMIYLPEDLHSYLARASRERGVSMAHVVREAVTQYRAGSEEAAVRTVDSLIGILNDDMTGDDLALSVDETLADYYSAGGDFEKRKGSAEPR